MKRPQPKTGFCAWCGQAQELIPNRGEKVCLPCIEADERVHGIDILVVDHRPGHAPFVHNTARDADKVYISNPGWADGRDMPGARRRRREAGRRGKPPVAQTAEATGVKTGKTRVQIAPGGPGG